MFFSTLASSVFKVSNRVACSADRSPPLPAGVFVRARISSTIFERRSISCLNIQSPRINFTYYNHLNHNVYLLWDYAVQVRKRRASSNGKPVSRGNGKD